MAPESYKPGRRMNNRGRDTKISEDRAAWVRIHTGTYVILVGQDIGEGSDVVFFIPPAMGRKYGAVSINLTSLTGEELSAFRELINTALDWAEPVVALRDKEAEIAWHNGDDTHTRNYREVPTVVYRKRPFGEHGESVQQRPPRVSQGGGRKRLDPPRGVRGVSDELAQSGASEAKSENDSSSPDDSA